MQEQPDQNTYKTLNLQKLLQKQKQNLNTTQFASIEFATIAQNKPYKQEFYKLIKSAFQNPIPQPQTQQPAFQIQKKHKITKISPENFDNRQKLDLEMDIIMHIDYQFQLLQQVQNANIQDKDGLILVLNIDSDDIQTNEAVLNQFIETYQQSINSYKINNDFEDQKLYMSQMVVVLGKFSHYQRELPKLRKIQLLCNYHNIQFYPVQTKPELNVQQSELQYVKKMVEYIAYKRVFQKKPYEDLEDYEINLLFVSHSDQNDNTKLLKEILTNQMDENGNQIEKIYLRQHHKFNLQFMNPPEASHVKNQIQDINMVANNYVVVYDVSDIQSFTYALKYIEAYQIYLEYLVDNNDQQNNMNNTSLSISNVNNNIFLPQKQFFLVGLYSQDNKYNECLTRQITYQKGYEFCMKNNIFFAELPIQNYLEKAENIQHTQKKEEVQEIIKQVRKNLTQGVKTLFTSIMKIISYQSINSNYFNQKAIFRNIYNPFFYQQKTPLQNNNNKKTDLKHDNGVQKESQNLEINLAKKYDYVMQFSLVGTGKVGKQLCFDNFSEEVQSNTLNKLSKVKYANKLNIGSRVVNVYPKEGNNEFSINVKTNLINYRDIESLLSYSRFKEFGQSIGYFLIFDLTNYQETLPFLQQWLEDYFGSYVKQHNIVHSHYIYLIGNKSDLLHKQKFKMQKQQQQDSDRKSTLFQQQQQQQSEIYCKEAQKLAMKYKIKYVELSILKNGPERSILQPLTNLITKIYHNIKTNIISEDFIKQNKGISIPNLMIHRKQSDSSISLSPTKKNRRKKVPILKIQKQNSGIMENNPNISQQYYYTSRSILTNTTNNINNSSAINIQETYSPQKKVVKSYSINNHNNNNQTQISLKQTSDSKLQISVRKEQKSSYLDILKKQQHQKHLNNFTQNKTQPSISLKRNSSSSTSQSKKNYFFPQKYNFQTFLQEQKKTFRQISESERNLSKQFIQPQNQENNQSFSKQKGQENSSNKNSNNNNKNKNNNKQYLNINSNINTSNNSMLIHTNEQDSGQKRKSEGFRVKKQQHLHNNYYNTNTSSAVLEEYTPINNSLPQLSVYSKILQNNNFSAIKNEQNSSFGNLSGFYHNNNSSYNQQFNSPGTSTERYFTPLKTQKKVSFQDQNQSLKEGENEKKPKHVFKIIKNQQQQQIKKQI